MSAETKTPDQIEHDINLSHIDEQDHKKIQLALDLMEPTIARAMFRDWIVKTIGEKNREIAELKTAPVAAQTSISDKISMLTAMAEQVRLEITAEHEADQSQNPDAIFKINQAFQRVDSALHNALDTATAYTHFETETPTR